MADIKDYAGGTPAWCPGCGDFPILEALKGALAQLNIAPSKAVVVSGIGQAGKLPHYMRVNTMNTLHGRTLPTATGVKLANPDLTVIAVGGDGDGYGEGGNHFLHALRKNPNITYLVCDNRVFGLTKGQASPTSLPGTVGGITPQGTKYPDFNPLLLGIISEAAFVARGASTHKEHLVQLICQAIQTPGLALIDILQPCVSFNKVNSWQWYRERIYQLDEHYDSTDQNAAMVKAREWGDKIPIGVIYRSGRPGTSPWGSIVGQTPGQDQIKTLLNRYRV